jgi:hypothetical protein
MAVVPMMPVVIMMSVMAVVTMVVMVTVMMTVVAMMAVVTVAVMTAMSERRTGLPRQNRKNSKTHEEPTHLPPILSSERCFVPGEQECSPLTF